MSNQLVSNRILEIAVLKAGGMRNLEASYDERVLDFVDQRYPRGISLCQLFAIVAEEHGYRGRHEQTVSLEMQRAAMSVNAGFSQVSLPTVLANVANKFLRAGWNSVDLTALKIAAIKPVNDLKTTTTVSLTGDTTFEKVGPTGEIKHGKLGEEVYSNKADTYARMLAITRTDFLNDDLGALVSVPRKLGRGAGLSLNEIFWSKFLNNAAFFNAEKKNIVAGNPFGSLGLSAAETKFAEQTDPDGNPLGVEPEILLVPTQLRTSAQTLIASESIKGETDEPQTNPWRDRFQVESSPYMNNPRYTGNSSSAYYLLANPEVMPVIEIAALFGRVEPFIESADADFKVLGVQMRGYSDVGVELQEHRGGVRVAAQ